MFGSNFFFSIILRGKYFLKSLKLTSIKGTFLEFRVEYVVNDLGIELRDGMWFNFLLFCKKVTIYGTILTRSAVAGKISPLMLL